MPSDTMCHSHENIFISSAQAIILYNRFDNYTFKQSQLPVAPFTNMD